ncbi:MAG: DUF4190 domain-containing protein [Phycisphaerales bacterium JB063]
MAPPPLPPQPRGPGGYNEPYVFYCVGCNQPLTDAALGGACPHCGKPTDESIKYHTASPSGGRTPGSAIASLVLGITSIVTCTLYGLPAIVCGILALYFASRAKRLIRSGEFGDQGKGMIVAGQVCGWVGLAFGLIYTVLIIVYIFFMVSMFQNMPTGPTWQPPPQQHQPWNPSPNTPGQPFGVPHSQPGGGVGNGSGNADDIGDTVEDIAQEEPLDSADQP